ncbi:MAG: Flp pilus assembly complex ATPase component TadA [Candidatus Heimdallarchaeota archaeon]|nr:MAG: Flp pilus assembly complex ATPase component TadA [Candidatus Heimdallarchaeota archaeon]
MEERRYSIASEETFYVPDTSAIINGGLRDILETKKIETESRVAIHASLIAELEHQANSGRKSGIKGLKELTIIRQICGDLGILLEYGGRRPHLSEIKRARSGEIDAIIRDFAWKENGILVTSDKIQHLVATSVGIQVIYIPTKKPTLEKTLHLEDYFDKETMSVHLKQGVPIFRKRGSPGNVRFDQLSQKICTKNFLKELSEEIIEKAQEFEDTFIEIDRRGSTIIQYGNIRIVICRPPFSDGWEITAARPLKKLTIEDYNLSSNLYTRLKDKAEGVLVAGSPGAGKTTFTRALALFFESKSKVVKTIESPRDLDLKAEITQYSKNFGTHSEIHDILLLSRPDYTIFDEIRDTEDFKLYTDLRLAGIGLVGVIHSSTAIDAIQRFIGRLELGMIPSVLDTIIYIEAGRINRVLDVKMTVKVPAGLVVSDLARPVVEVRDFETREPVYEMYTFGEQTVVIPLENEELNLVKVDSRTIQDITEAIEEFSTQPVVLIPKDRYGRRYEIQCAQNDIPLILGRGGENIKMLERSFHVKLDVNKSEKDTIVSGYSLLNDSMLSHRKRTMIISFPKKMKNLNIQFFRGDLHNKKKKPFFIGTTSRSGKIKLSSRSDAGRIFKEKLDVNTVRIYWKQM